MYTKNLLIPLESFTRGGKIIVTEVGPDYEYKDGVRNTSKVVGLKVSVVFQANNYDSQVVKVSNPIDNLSILLEKATPDNPLCVEFVNFYATVYPTRGNDGRPAVGISARASDVKPISNNNSEKTAGMKPVSDDNYEVVIDD